jgi:hypothetical protein
MIAELERRTRAEWQDDAAKTHLDYVAYWLMDGKTFRSLARELSVSVGFLHDYLRLEFGVEAKTDVLLRAREVGAHTFSDESLDIADAATEDTASVARLQVQTRQWVAERWNARELGKQTPAIQVSIGTLMLDALRQPAARAELAGPSAIVAAIADEATDVTIELATDSDAE